MERSHEMQAKTPPQGGNPILMRGGRVSRGITLTVLTVAGVGAGLVLGWDSLVAAGLAPILLAVLPCAAMCALGLCAGRTGGKELGTGVATGAVPPKEAPGASAPNQAR